MQPFNVCKQIKKSKTVEPNLINSVGVSVYAGAGRCRSPAFMNLIRASSLPKKTIKKNLQTLLNIQFKENICGLKIEDSNLEMKMKSDALLWLCDNNFKTSSQKHGQKI